MNEKEFEILKIVADVTASKKRLLILIALNDNLFLGYNSIRDTVDGHGITVGSSEMYKHTNVLIKHGLIEHVENKFIITDRGKKFVIGLSFLMETFEQKQKGTDFSGDKYNIMED